MTLGFWAHRKPDFLTCVHDTLMEDLTGARPRWTRWS